MTAMNCVGCVDGESACSSLARRAFKEDCGIGGFLQFPSMDSIETLSGQFWELGHLGYLLSVGPTKRMVGVRRTYALYQP